MSKVGDVIEAGNANWRFSGAASKQFEQHIRRSVPCYDMGHDIVLSLSDFFIHSGSVVYDLGSATGLLSKQLAARHHNKNVRLTGIDLEPDMISEASNELPEGVQFDCQDVVTATLEPNDLSISYYTMQFVQPRFRQQVFNKIYDALHWGGGFILFEKVRAPDARFQDMMTTLYHDYKLEQGYSGEEIVNKSRSLKGVLEPFSSAANIGLLERAGFSDVTSVFKYLCFEGFLAIK